MARIFYKAHYTELVEHFFRMATRHDREDSVRVKAEIDT